MYVKPKYQKQRKNYKSCWCRCNLPNNDKVLWYKDFERDVEYGINGSGEFSCFEGGVEPFYETFYEVTITGEERNIMMKHFYDFFMNKSAPLF